MNPHPRESYGAVASASQTPNGHTADAQSLAVTPAMDLGHGPPWLGAAHDRRQIDAQWLVVMLSLLGVGIIFFGFRGVMQVVATALAAVLTYVIFVTLYQLIRKRRPRHHVVHVFSLGMLLGLALPLFVHTFAAVIFGGVLGVCALFVGRSHALRVHPVALVLVLLWLAPDMLTLMQTDESVRNIIEPSRSVLRPKRLVIGDAHESSRETDRMPWFSILDTPLTDAVCRSDTAGYLLQYRTALLTNRDELIDSMSTGDLCHMEELFFGANINGIGTSSRFALIVLGFYLMYRRLASWKVASFAGMTALGTLLFMPLWIEDQWMTVLENLILLGPAAGVSYIAYFLFATPLTFIIMILAPLATPMSSLGRLLYSLILGCGTMAAMWWLKQPEAAYLALIVASLLSRPLDALQRSPFAK